MRISIGLALLVVATFAPLARSQAPREADKKDSNVQESSNGSAGSKDSPADKIKLYSSQLELAQKQLEQAAAQRTEAEKQRAMALEQRALAEQQRAQYEAAMKQLRNQAEVLARQAQSGGFDREALEKSLAMAHEQLAVMSANQNQSRSQPLPEDAITRVFALRNSKAGDTANVIDKIVGDRGMRMAVDDRTNALVVSGSKNTCDIVEALVSKLDESKGRGSSDVPGETLQLRIMWLLDGLGETEGQEPKPELVSPQVLDALQQLGFQAPRVACQQVSTLMLGKDNRENQFHFEIPVLINLKSWQLQGRGAISPVADDRFALQFEMQIQKPDNSQKSQLGGSIYSPLGHYTVLGTTTFVEEQSEVLHPDRSTRVEPEQHLSAFVLFLDRAEEFPAANPYVPSSAAPKAKP